MAAACADPAAGAVAYGLRRASRELDERRVPLLGVTAAFVFAAQMLNFPVAGGRIVADGRCPEMLADAELLGRHDLELPAGFDLDRLSVATS